MLRDDANARRLYWPSSYNMSTIYASDLHGQPVKPGFLPDTTTTSNSPCGYEALVVAYPESTSLVAVSIADFLILGSGNVVVFDSNSNPLIEVDAHSSASSLFFPQLPFLFGQWNVKKDKFFFSYANNTSPFSNSLS